LLSFSLLVTGLVVPALPAVAADTGLSLGKEAPDTVLVNGKASYSLTASNTGNDAQYNVSFRDVLPAGVRYEPGSTMPAGNEPLVIADKPLPGQTTLIWRDAFDLQPSDSNGISFGVSVDPASHPVGNTVTNNADVYANTNPRTVPAFNPDGSVRAASFSSSAASGPVSTTVTALEVAKSEPSPESELLRGVHTQTTVYTVKVTNNTFAATDGVVVTDYLPANLEFLGCGAVDNGPEEFPGAPSLAGTPVIDPCLVPASVETVQNPAGYPDGVYTKVVWELGSMTAGQVTDIRYAAGVPLRENTLFDSAPTPESLGQAANLANNTGAPTRQVDGGDAATNYVEAAGRYSGKVEADGPPEVMAKDQHTVTVHDLRILKSSAVQEFKAGEVVTYTLQLDASEYASSNGIVITDVLPDGLCPLGTYKDKPKDCELGGQEPSVPYKSVTHDLTAGTFTLVFEPQAVIEANGSYTLTYPALMRKDYSGGSLSNTPTSAGDAFQNKVSQTAVTTPIPANPVDAGTVSVTDPSSAGLSTDAESLTKEIGLDSAPMTCSSADFRAEPSGTDDVTFAKGDRVCFKVSVKFSGAVETRNAVVTDFLPTNLTYEDGSATVSGFGPGVQFSADQGLLTWTLGDSVGGSRIVPAGSVFTVVFSAIVNSAPAQTGDKTGNLAKLRATNTAGQARSHRDEVNFLTEKTPLSIDKNASAAQVRAGDNVTYTLKVENSSSRAVKNVQVWDVLPEEIRCTDISNPGGGTCTDPKAPGHPNFAGNANHSALTWNIADIAPGASHDLSYQVKMPSYLGVSETLTNTAHVRSYEAVTNMGDTVTHYPGENIDTSVDKKAQDPDPVRDDALVQVPSAAVAKGVTSTVGEAGNTGSEPAPDASTQAAIGEKVTYTVTATIPAKATVYNGVLKDTLPEGLSIFGSPAITLPDGLPGSAVVSGNTVTVNLGDYANTSEQDQVLRMVIEAVVTDLAANTAGTNRTNTATLSSGAGTYPGATDPEDRSASAQTGIVEPVPEITKTNDHPASDHTVTGGDVITYTVTARNASGSVLHNAVLTDCLPAGLTLTTTGLNSRVLAADEAGCPAGSTLISWNLGDLAPGAPDVVHNYTAKVEDATAGSLTYTNTVQLAGTSLNDAQADGDVRTYTTSAESSVKTAGATVEKTATPAAATKGETVTYTVKTTIPANINFYNLTILDDLPAGIDPASVAVVGTGDVTHLKGPDGDPKIGFLLGDYTSSTQERIVTVQYTARVVTVEDPAAGANLLNKAYPAWNTVKEAKPTTPAHPFDQQGQDSSATVKVLEPKVSLSKAVSDSTPEPGESFTYTVRATNWGGANASAAHNVVITDVVPSNVRVGNLGNGGVLTGHDPQTGGGTITWNISKIDPGAWVELTYTANLAASGQLTADGLKNTAKVASYTSLPGTDPADTGQTYPGPEASATVTPAFPKLAASKSTPNGDIAYRGQPFTWQVKVTNSGQGTALNAGATDKLPENWTYVPGSALVSVNNGGAAAVEPVISGVRNLTWANLGSLPPGTSLTITYQAVPATAAAVGMATAHRNTATPTGTDPTGEPGNKTGSYSGPSTSAEAKIASADLSIEKTVGKAPVAGLDGSWIMTVTNNGPDTAAGPFKVKDTFDLQNAATVTGISGTGWTCQIGTMECTRTGTLASGDSFEPITVTYSVIGGGQSTVLTNTAQVTGQTHDPVPENNTDTATARVTAYADLVLSKDLVGSMVAGQQATYTLEVRNAGPSVARGGFTITDTIPAGTSFVSASGTWWSCGALADGKVTCSYLSDLPSGAKANVLTLVLAVDSSATEAITNTATVTPVTPEAPDGEPQPTENNTDTATATPGQVTDLGIAKVLSSKDLVAGQQATYAVSVTNYGPSAARDVVVIDDLDPRLTYVSSAGSDWTCSAVDQKVSCAYTANGGVLPAASPAVATSFDLTVLVSASSGGTDISNTASVTTSTPEVGPAPNTSTSTGPTTARADLTLAKSHSDTAIAGQNLAYTLVVTNNGPSNSSLAAGGGYLKVTDILPDGMSFVSASAGWRCTTAGQLVTCDYPGNLAPGGSVSLVMTVAIAAHVQGVVSNAAFVTGDGTVPDREPGNNHSTDPTEVLRESVLSLTKTLDTPAPVVAGTTARFTLQAVNAGPGNAESVTVRDTLPQYLSFVSASGAGWTCEAYGQDVVCERPTASLGAQPPITVLAAVDPAVPVTPANGVLTVQNVAELTSGTPSTITNPGPVDVPIIASADLQLTKAASAATVEAGTGMDWTLNVSNNGPSTAAGPLTVTDTLPAGQSFVSAAGAGWVCTAAAPPSDPNMQQLVTCTFAGSLAPGASAEPLVLTVLVGADAAEADMENTAVVSSPTPDPVPANNSGTAVVSVDRVLSLGITKTHTGNGTVGELKDFRITVTNTGTSNVQDLQVQDVLPAGLVFESAAGNGWTCTEAEGTVSCDHPATLAPGESAADIVITVMVEPAAYPSALNTAVASSQDPDLPGTSTTDDRLDVDPSAILELAKVHNGEFAVGSQGTYTLTVTNTGPTATPGSVVIQDELPDSLRFVSAAGDGWSCAASGQDVECDRPGELAVGSSAELVLTVDVLAGAYPQVENTATARAPGSTPVTSTDTAPVLPLVSWNIEKVLDGYSNHQASYLISVTNTGQNTSVAPVTVTDNLPAGLEFVSAGGTGWDCPPAGARVECRYDGGIAPGGTRELTVVAKVTAAPGTVVENVASVSGGAGSSGSVMAEPSADSGPALVEATADGKLANTGASGMRILWAALLLLLAGAGILWLERRRPRGTPA